MNCLLFLSFCVAEDSLFFHLCSCFFLISVSKKNGHNLVDAVCAVCRQMKRYRMSWKRHAASSGGWSTCSRRSVTRSASYPCGRRPGWTACWWSTSCGPATTAPPSVWPNTPALRSVVLSLLLNFLRAGYYSTAIRLAQHSSIEVSGAVIVT